MANSVFDLIDLSGFNDEGLLALQDKVRQEIVARKIEKSAILAVGEYIGGKTIPVGEYIISETGDPDDTSDDFFSQFVQLRGADDQFADGKREYKLYENVKEKEHYSIFAKIEEGDVLRLGRRSKATIFSGLAFE